MPPEVVGKWKIGRRVASGGQARVYEASAEGEPVRAIKLIQTTGAKKRARFAQEVRRHIALVEQGAKNVVPILDHNLDGFERGETIGYIVMPLAVTTLYDSRSTFVGRPELCLEVFRGIVVGVRDAHRAGNIHRDLKPHNILFVEGSLRTPLLADFGICFVKGTPDEARLTQADETVGARFFMAPEQERGGVVDVQETADIYALGKLLHFMTTGRYLSRENLEETFTPEELASLPKLAAIRDDILARTIVYDKDGRFRSADDLLDAVDRLIEKFGGGGGGPVAVGPSPSPSLGDMSAVAGIYAQTAEDLDSGRLKSVKARFDLALGELGDRWINLREAYAKQPDRAEEALRLLIESQPVIVGQTLAMARFDAHEVFAEFKSVLERTTRLSEKDEGYAALIGVPHALAGFVYMLACCVSLFHRSWSIFGLLLDSKFEWYYQSGRPIYDYGFEHPQFFHSETFGRRASAVHDFFRKQLARDEIFRLLGLDAEGLLSLYVQTQMLLCVRAAKAIEAGEDIRTFADFGRFYEHRVVPLLDRVSGDPDFAKGLAGVFGEKPEEWLSKLDARLEVIRRVFWGTTDYFWNSVEHYEPR